MSERTLIAWTDFTFNPFMGCTKVSPGCKNCYAETLTKNRMGLSVWGPGIERKRTSVGYWRGPIKWNREAKRRMRVFCGSLCDVFEKGKVTDTARVELWRLIDRKSVV